MAAQHENSRKVLFKQSEPSEVAQAACRGQKTITAALNKLSAESGPSLSRRLQRDAGRKGGQS